MDETEIYIKISDCPEIQGQRKPKVEKMPDGRRHYEWELETGDYFATKDLCSKEERQVEIKGTTIYDPYFYDKKQDANITISQVGFDEGGGYVTKKFIWLPRQDQIQKMMYENLARADAIVHDLNKWREENYDYQLQFITMEQFLLAFYMWEKHSKTWDGEKWIKKQ